MGRLTLLLCLVASPVWAQEYPPESPPIQPSIALLWMVVHAPVMDLPSAPPGEPIDQLILGPSNIFTSQADINTWCTTAQTAANGIYAADPANPTRLRLHCVYLPNYVSPNKMDVELNAMQTNHVGQTSTCPTSLTCTWSPIPPPVDVAALRAQYRADRVTMIDRDGSSCGLAYVNAATFGPQWAFSVVNKDCAVGNKSLAHELGHNDGLCHDTTNAANCTPAKPYGYGYCDPNGPHQSPMTYPSPCGKPRTIFSNKDNTTTYGYAYGDATHDEAAVQRWAMPIEANFYDSGTPVPTAPGKPSVH